MLPDKDMMWYADESVGKAVRAMLNGLPASTQIDALVVLCSLQACMLAATDQVMHPTLVKDPLYLHATKFACEVLVDLVRGESQ